ncbi:MAG TPA: nuclear transport factor 2 family protein, partial [Sphingomicrobium sp.]|nr:nuclear transport factor 2 family protein [Sphingomicrobium sp.]
LLTAIALSTAACPDRPRTTAGVLATEKAWVAAIERRDVTALSCILDPTFADNNWRGQRVAREEVLAKLPHRPSSELHLSELRVTVRGDMAMVRGVNRQTAPDGKTVGAVRFTDVFLYRGGSWRAIAAQETVIQTPTHAAAKQR